MQKDVSRMAFQLRKKNTLKKSFFQTNMMCWERLAKSFFEQP
jgi:hypothetical protein